jgi:hypothetical protein
MSRHRPTKAKRKSDDVDAEAFWSESADSATARAEAGPQTTRGEPALNAGLQEASPSANAEQTALEGDVQVPHESIDEAVSDHQKQNLDYKEMIQKYMTDLLARARGEVSRNVSAAPQQVDPTSSDDAIPLQEHPRSEAAKPNVCAGKNCLVPNAPADLTPGPEPPEGAYWDSMRELANSHASDAIDAHNKKCLLQRTLNNAAAGLACLVGTVVALACAPTLGAAMAIGKIAGVVASIYFLYVSFVSARAWQASRTAPAGTSNSESKPC